MTGRRRAVRVAAVVAVALPVFAASSSSASGAAGFRAVTVSQPGKDYAYQTRDLDSVIGVGPGDVWAVGNYVVRSSGITQPVALHRVGGSWRSTTLPAHTASTTLHAIAASGPRNLWAVGRSGTALYLVRNNGTGWRKASTTGMPRGFLADGIAVGGPNNVWLGGYQQGVRNAVAVHWNGTRWTSTRAPLPSGASTAQFNALSLIPRTGRVAGVGYSYRNGTTTPYMATWTGRSWVRRTGLPSAGELHSVVMRSPTDGWAVGTDHPSSTSATALLAHWNGKTWRGVRGGTRAGNTYLISVGGTGTNVWAAGYSRRCATCHDRTLLEHWNGRAWTVVASPNSARADADNHLLGISTVPRSSSVWAVGAQGPRRAGNGAEYFLAAWRD